MAIIVEKGQKFVVVHGPNGEVVSKTLLGPDDSTSHANFFRNKGQYFEEGVAADRNSLRRSAAVTKRVEQVLMEMVQPPASVVLKSITDQDFLDIMAHPEVWAEERFTPLASYYHKIAKIRPLWKGEVGVVEKENGSLDYYLVLEKGYERMSVAVSGYVPAEAVATALIAGGAKLLGTDPVPPPAAESEPVSGELAFIADVGEKRVLVIAADEEDARSAFPDDMVPTKMVRSPALDRCGAHTVVLLGGRMVCSVCGAKEEAAEDA